VEIPAGKEVIVVGDLHGCLEHFEAVIGHDGNTGKIETGKAVLLLLGDLPHDDRPRHLEDMETSIELLERVAAFTVDHPGGVIHLRGNHDSLDHDVSKGGVLQGLLFHETLRRERGKSFTDAIGRYFESLPLFALGAGFAAVHAGPPRGGCDRLRLVEAGSDDALAFLLVWNRGRGASPFSSSGDYAAEDVKLMRQLLGLPDSAPFIVGHSPLWHRETPVPGLWMNALGIANHHILYSGYESSAPYISIRNGKLEVKSPF
jgi:hypothetical protein